MRAVYMFYGLACYGIGVASLVLFILFANNHIGILLPEYASLGIDHANGAPMANPLLVNLGLVLLFGLQHTVMARPGFKAVLTRLVPKSAERSTYVLMTGIVTLALVQYWQPMTGTIWHVENETGRLLLTLLFYFGWMISLAATYMIDHFHLMGLQQSFQPGADDAGAKTFVTPMLYKFVRHPIQTGIVIGLLGTPDMTVGRLTLTLGLYAYIAVGLMYEERDLIAEFGDTYRAYKARVPGLLPWFGRRRS